MIGAFQENQSIIVLFWFEGVSKNIDLRFSDRNMSIQWCR